MPKTSQKHGRDRFNGPFEVAFALPGTLLAERQQAAKPRIAEAHTGLANLFDPLF
jgi:hypothetical protein